MKTERYILFIFIRRMNGTNDVRVSVGRTALKMDTSTISDLTNNHTHRLRSARLPVKGAHLLGHSTSKETLTG